jgi:hypothetical protein
MRWDASPIGTASTVTLFTALQSLLRCTFPDRTSLAPATAAAAARLALQEGKSDKTAPPRPSNCTSRCAVTAGPQKCRLAYA